MTSSLILPRWLAPALVAVIVLSFGLRNLPWHLDDFDQAKQAFVSWEMVQEGHWWFQHTPSGKVATKPPLAGWISAGLALATSRNWELAWRLPPFLCSLALLLLLWRAGCEVGGQVGAVLAASAFGLNVVSQRLATLVRTDMLLALTIFLIGHLIYQKLRRDEPWRARDRWLLGLILLASFLIKGPIAYAFLLPGLIFFLVLQRRTGRAHLVWCGWWPWVLPLLCFGVWAGFGIYGNREFYQQVVLTEFLGRFQSGEGAPHRSQPFYFYVIHLLHLFFPWSVGLIALASIRDVREKVRRDPALLWLVCWAGAGLLVMSLIPSKRPDRIFPVLPPLCLLLGAMVPLLPSGAAFRLTSKMVLGVIGIGFFASFAYLMVKVTQGYRTHQGGLKSFGRESLKLVGAQPLAITGGKDEGMLLYLGLRQFTRPDDALADWQRGQLRACVMTERDWFAQQRVWKTTPVLRSGTIPEKNSSYVLLINSAAHR